MAIMTKLMKIGAVVAALVAVFVGILLTPIPKKLGFYRWLAYRDPSNQVQVGLTPAFHYGVSWNFTFQELYDHDLTGQTAIVTGANAGIGFELSLALARLGADVTMACRNPTKCEKAADSIRNDKEVRGKVTTMTVDTSSLSSVKAFGEAYKERTEGKALDMLFLNAGIGFVDDMDGQCLPLSEDGIEIIFATNYVGHHLLYKLLEPMLQQSKLARIVQTSSTASFQPYKTFIVATDLETLNGCIEPPVDRHGNHAYGQSKLAQILWVKQLTKLLGPESTIYANAFHPGVVDTTLFDKAQESSSVPTIVKWLLDWFRRLAWSAEEGALTGLFLGVATDRLVEGNIRGKYFHPQSQQATNPLAENETLQKDLWDFSEKLVEEFV